MQQSGGQAQSINKKDTAQTEETRDTGSQDMVSLSSGADDEVDDGAKIRNGMNMGMTQQPKKKGETDSAAETGTRTNYTFEREAEESGPADETPGTGGASETPGTGGASETPGTGSPETPGTGSPETPGTGSPETPGTGGTEGPKKHPDDPGKLTDEEKAAWQEAQQNIQEWNDFMVHLMAERQKALTEMLKYLMDIQNEIHSMMQEMAANQSKTASACARMWDDVIRGR